MFLGPKCPYCKKKIKDLLFDYETGIGKCTICKASYDLKKAFSINDAKLLARLMKGNAKEQLMKLFNLEEIPKAGAGLKRSWIYVLFWATFFILLIIMTLTLNETIGKKISSLLGITIFALYLIYIYKKETKDTIIRVKPDV